MEELAAWESFYVIVGSSAAALTGLMFVVITLIADLDDPTSSSGSVAAFGTPTIVHFCAALVLSAALSAPWRSVSSVSAALGVVGGAGLAYTLTVIYRARQQSDYRPVLEDWLWHTVFPIAAYGAVVLAAATLGRGRATSLFVVGASALSLVLIGIHNAWDTVTYLAVSRRGHRGGRRA